MTTPRYRIVIALDQSEYSEIVLEHAIDQAARHDRPELHFITVVEARDDVAAAKQWLATQVIGGLEPLGERERYTRLHVRIGKPADEIANMVGELEADLLVIGRFGGHKSGSTTADRAMRAITCPTLVVSLGGRSVDANPQCDKCIALRERSDGEQWFCDEHSSPDRIDLTTRLPMSASLTGGGLLW